MKAPAWRFCAYALVILVGIAIALPSFVARDVSRAFPDLLPPTPVAPGLDLREGASLILRADEKALAAKMPPEARDTLTDALASGGSALAMKADGDALLIPRSEVQSGDKDFRVLIEAGLPTFQRSALAPAETAHTLADPTVLRDLPGRIAGLTFHLVLPDSGSANPLPADALRLPMSDGSGVHLILKRESLQSERLATAITGFNRQINAPVVQFRLDTKGALLFGELTQSLVEQPLSIVFGGIVLGASVIREAVPGGPIEISGDFNVEKTAQLAASLRAGALPVPLEVIVEQTVGADAVAGGLWTGLAVFALTAAVMDLLHGAWGIVATGALLLNIWLFNAGMTVLGATLTLPGIVGLILGTALALGANLLLHKRIREEIARGRKAASALRTVFDRAYRANLHSHVTTLIATTRLFLLESGAVKGFALTMGLGLLISLLTAVTVVRSTRVIHLGTGRPKTLAIRAPLNFLRKTANSTFRFMRMRFIGPALTRLPSSASITLLVTPGLNEGTGLRCGTLFEAHVDVGPEIATLRDADAHRPSSENAAARSHPSVDQPDAGAMTLHVGYGTGCGAELCHADGFGDRGRLPCLPCHSHPASPRRPALAPRTARSCRSHHLETHAVKPTARRPSRHTNERTSPCSTQPPYSQDLLRSA